MSAHQYLCLDKMVSLTPDVPQESLYIDGAFLHDLFHHCFQYNKGTGPSNSSAVKEISQIEYMFNQWPLSLKVRGYKTLFYSNKNYRWACIVHKWYYT